MALKRSFDVAFPSCILLTILMNSSSFFYPPDDWTISVILVFPNTPSASISSTSLEMKPVLLVSVSAFWIILIIDPISPYAISKIWTAIDRSINTSLFPVVFLGTIASVGFEVPESSIRSVADAMIWINL